MLASLGGGFYPSALVSLIETEALDNGHKYTTNSSQAACIILASG